MTAAALEHARQFLGKKVSVQMNMRKICFFYLCVMAGWIGSSCLVVAAPTPAQWDAMTAAIVRGDVTTVDWLYHVGEFSVDTPGADGRTLEQIALDASQWAVVWYVRRIADSRQPLSDGARWHFMIQAIIRGDISAVAQLIGLPPFNNNIWAATLTGRTLVSIASCHHQDHVSNFLSRLSHDLLVVAERERRRLPSYARMSAYPAWQQMPADQLPLAIRSFWAFARIQELLGRPRQHIVFSDSDEHSFLSNFYPTSVRMFINGNVYCFKTAEAAFQAGKYPQDTRLLQILADAPDGYTARAIGQTHVAKSPWWTSDDPLLEGGRVAWMNQVLKAKFRQGHLLRALTETGLDTLIADNPDDRFWGGSLPDGKNMFGKLLMDMRTELSGL